MTEIYALRQALGWSQGDLGRCLRLYVTQNGICPTVSRWERGKSSPSLVYLDRIEQLIALIRADPALLAVFNRPKPGWRKPRADWWGRPRWK